MEENLRDLIGTQVKCKDTGITGKVDAVVMYDSRVDEVLIKYVNNIGTVCEHWTPRSKVVSV